MEQQPFNDHGFLYISTILLINYNYYVNNYSIFVFVLY